MPRALDAASCLAARAAATAVALGADAKRGEGIRPGPCFGCHALDADREDVAARPARESGR